LVKEQVRDIHDLTSVWSGERVKAATAKPDAKGGRTKPLRGVGACGWRSAPNSALLFV
jgi:hypothetical protein